MATGPVALITGGARRIGAEIVRGLHQRQCRVIVHYHRSAADAEALVAELNQRRADSAMALPADLNDPHAVRDLADRALDAFGTLQVLVNNASSFYPTPLALATDQDWDALMHSNLRAPFLLSQRLAGALADTGTGAIVNLVDVYAEKPLLNHSLYCMAKAGLATMTRGLARELGPAVRVNGVAPGAILWPEPLSSENGQDQQATIVDATALGRAGSPGDIAGAVAWLALDAPYVTGQILAVDGGRSLSFPGG
ncbi:pteridine reductase (plasmid) [Alcanivorax sp. N3-2A]|nr:pteridine reductase [Alcanivorax sp. N3-2A]ASK36819.1 pteridine reductase [Alcanivorax sp. N3-2A]|tara:strand:- start:22033 stop:22791 length:759 start_codon:yes stop_codon:yes gene_type:complete